MSNILDYLDWYGDLSLGTVPFNEVDNLILAQLSYLDLDVCHDGATVSEVADAYFLAHGKREIYSAEGLVSPLTPFLLPKMAAGRRFSDARVRMFESRMDAETREQFAAVTFDLSDGTSYVAFRGTDDSLVGWHEDFILSFRTAEAQTDATGYLGRVAASCDRPLRVGGHSKGGNLAAYAAAMCDDATRERVIQVWCDDSPGFSEALCPLERLEAIAGRTRLLVPAYCIVARVLSHVVDPEVILSDGEGAMQHSGMNWQVLGPRFVRSKAFEPGSERLGLVIESLLAENDPIHLERLTEEVFACLAASGATTVSGLMSCGTDGLGRVVTAVSRLEDPDRTTINQMLLALLGQAFSDAVAPILAPLGHLARHASDGAAEKDPALDAKSDEPTGDSPTAADDVDTATNDATDKATITPTGVDAPATDAIVAAGDPPADTPASIEEMLAWRERQRREEILSAPKRLATRMADAAASAASAAEKGLEAARAAKRLDDDRLAKPDESDGWTVIE